VSWVHLNTAFAGTANLDIFATPFQQDATGRPGGAYTISSQDVYSALFRIQRNFLYRSRTSRQDRRPPAAMPGAFVWHGQQPYGALCARSVERAAVERNTMKETPHAEQAAVHGNL
jgi:hypothetical protein